LPVRPATVADAAGINAVYNHYIRETPITFDLAPWELAQRQAWLHEHAGGRHQVFVAVERDVVVGFASSGPWRPKAAYERCVETSIYVAPEHVGRGLGNALYAELFAALEGHDVHRVLAGVTMPNDASVAIHERFGFARAGYFTEQGYKFDRYWDVAWFERPMRAE
jgi:phosphinothricin acetyltransferase